MKFLDSIVTWVIFLAIVTVVVASGKTDAAIAGIAKLVNTLIGTITAPQSGGSG